MARRGEEKEIASPRGDPAQNGSTASSPARSASTRTPSARSAATRSAATRNASTRSAARLAAVQALYQMDMTAIDLGRVIAEFEAYRLGKEVEDSQYCEAEAAFFRALVEGVVREQLRIDPLIDGHLAEGWRLHRVDSILRAILRAGSYEMLMRKDVPARVVITEYVDLAHAFFAGEEPKVVNGILDKLGRELRPQDFAPQGPDND
jgi:transcription antitermination protein NusB